MDMADEMRAMNEGKYTPSPKTSAPPTNAPETSAPETQAPSTDAPTTDAPKDETTDAPKTDAPKTEAPTTDAPDESDEAERLRIENAELKALLEGKAKTDPPGTKSPETKAPTTDAPEEDFDFLGSANMEEVTSDPKTFNAILNSVFKKGIQRGTDIRESILKSIPNVISQVVAQQTAIRSASDKFYRDNKDLDTPNRRKIVAVETEKIIAKNPDYTLEKALEESEKAVRKKLGLKKRATARREGKPAMGKKPKGPKRGEEKDKKPKLTGMQKEINDMINSTQD